MNKLVECKATKILQKEALIHKKNLAEAFMSIVLGSLTSSFYYIT